MNDAFFTNCKTKCISDMSRLGTYFFIADWRIVHFYQNSQYFERLRLLAFRGNCEDEEDWYGAGKNADFITDLIWRFVRVSLFSVLMRAGKPLK